jgi:PBP1b-binding outer membrane lipoprotein LpoB
MVMKYLSMLLLSVILLTSCKSPTTTSASSDDDIPSLKVSNKVECAQTTDVATIQLVNLLGYIFKPLAIEVGESVTFSLAEGMPSGLENITVQVIGMYGFSNGFTESLDVDFRKGETTKVRIVAPEYECGFKGVVLEIDE